MMAEDDHLYLKSVTNEYLAARLRELRNFPRKLQFALLQEAADRLEAGDD